MQTIRPSLCNIKHNGNLKVISAELRDEFSFPRHLIQPSTPAFHETLFTARASPLDT
jgi:hypothetical protein